MKRLLVIRFSAIGDVAMMVPVVCSCACQNPQLRITVLSREFMRPLFAQMPPNVDFIAADLKGRHKGVAGLTRLFRELRAMRFDAVADMHDVLRTKYLRVLFRACGVKTACIDKGRKGKKQLTDAIEKKLVQQKTSFERYTDVLRALGIGVNPDFRSIFGNGRGDLARAGAEGRPRPGPRQAAKWLLPAESRVAGGEEMDE